MNCVSDDLETILATMSIHSYDNEPAEVRNRMQRLGYDLNDPKMVIVRYDSDPTSVMHGFSQILNCSLQSGLGNFPGPYLAVNCGSGNTAKSPELRGHPELKYLLMNVLMQFSIPFYVCVKTGNIMINVAHLCKEQVRAFRRFAVLYCLFNERQFIAGYDYAYFNKTYPEKFSFEHNCKWPTGVSDEYATRHGSGATKYLASKCYNLFVISLP